MGDANKDFGSGEQLGFRDRRHVRAAEHFGGRRDGPGQQR